MRADALARGAPNAFADEWVAEAEAEDAARAAASAMPD
jgi:hypothetical protein